jgi:mannose-6-phosphate isomerase-like protein (cupin superfamily)
MKALVTYLILVSLAFAAEPVPALHPDDLPPITVSPGVILKELTGRSAPAGAKSDRCSVAFFHLEPGKASAWSYNKLGEESFFILKGQGEVWTGGRAQTVRPGSFILIPATVVRSIRASQGEALEFYAITAPAWAQSDDILTTAPIGAPK